MRSCAAAGERYPLAKLREESSGWMFLKPACIALALSIATIGDLFPQTGGSVVSRKGRVERIKVHGKSLEGNLAGDSAVRDVSVYLPPQYDTNRSQRFPSFIFCTATPTQTTDGTVRNPDRDFKLQARPCRESQIVQWPTASHAR
jgi:hypothetical protein